MPHKAKPKPRHPRRISTVQARQRIFLKRYAAIGVFSKSADAAGASLRTVAGWLLEDRDFHDAFTEAKIRFHDHLEETIVNRINGVDTRKNDVLLRFKVQAELPEKYGRPGKKPKGNDHHRPADHRWLTQEEIERAVREEYDPDGPLP